jgi:hypothetical protein
MHAVDYVTIKHLCPTETERDTISSAILRTNIILLLELYKLRLTTGGLRQTHSSIIGKIPIKNIQLSYYYQVLY